MPSAPTKPAPSAEKVERIARVCHEAERAHRQGSGDYSFQAWDHAPPWQREQVRNAVTEALTGKTVGNGSLFLVIVGALA